ncbi:MAG: hypothetical protein LKCHEGNO_02665 [Burkholderiaceae bacterium]|nr:hypothetical protein [Burkholderiaceae bacterium]
MEDNELLHVQRRLRRRLFEGSTAIRWRPGRELAAQLLLYLDDPHACWRITTEWLRETLDADRVDGGFGGFVGIEGRAHHYVAIAETRRGSNPLPSVLGLEFDAFDPGMQAVWRGHAVAAIGDVSQERSFTPRMRSALHEVGTAAKLALPVRDGVHPVGIICADWHRESPRWDAELCNQAALLTQGALGPLLAASARLALERTPDELLGHAAGAPHGAGALGEAGDEAALARARELAALTPAEFKVAQLVAMGLSYKEVARRIERSLSTVDHQLRSIRDKLGVRSTARLVHVLSERLERLRP